MAQVPQRWHPPRGHVQAVSRTSPRVPHARSQPRKARARREPRSPPSSPEPELGAGRLGAAASSALNGASTEPRAPSPGPGAGGPRPAPPPRSRQRARGRGRPGQSSARQRHREAPGGAAPSRSRLHSGSASPGGRRYRPHVVPVADASAAPVAPGCARPGGGARRELTGGSARLGWVGLGSLGLSVVRLCPARSRSARPGTAAEEQQGGGGPAPPAGWPSPTPRFRGN